MIVKIGTWCFYNSPFLLFKVVAIHISFRQRHMISAGRLATRSLLNARLPTFVTAAAYSSASTSNPKPPQKADGPQDKWNYNVNPFDGTLGEDHRNLKPVDANALESASSPPVGVRMLVRDFIEDSLYNPHYGYFPKQATIFDTQKTSFDFSSFRDSVEFQEEVARKYAAYGADKHDGPGRQLWHTPTELFKVFRPRIIPLCWFNFLR